MRLDIETMLRKAATRLAHKQPLEAVSIYAEILKKFPHNIRAKSSLADLNKIAETLVNLTVKELAIHKSTFYQWH
mgnify:CR=1 FL=1